MNVDDCIYWNICQSHVCVLKANPQHEGGSLNTPWGYLWIQGKARMCCKRNGQFFFFVFTIHSCESVCLLLSKKHLQNFPIQENVYVAFRCKRRTRAVCKEATKADVRDWRKIIKVFLSAETVKILFVFHWSLSSHYLPHLRTRQTKEPSSPVLGHRRVTTGWFIKIIIFITEAFLVSRSQLYHNGFFT